MDDELKAHSLIVISHITVNSESMDVASNVDGRHKLVPYCLASDALADLMLINAHICYVFTLQALLQIRK